VGGKMQKVKEDLETYTGSSGLLLKNSGNKLFLIENQGGNDWEQLFFILFPLIYSMESNIFYQWEQWEQFLYRGFQNRRIREFRECV
jgi:hypothetical protein